MAIRYHVDVVLPVAPYVATGIALEHAALAGSPFHPADAHGQRCDRLFPDSDRPGCRGRDPDHCMSSCPGRALSAFTRVFDALWREPGPSAQLAKLTICRSGSRLFARCA